MPRTLAPRELDITDMQWLFVREYALDPTKPTKAAISAGYSEKTAAVQASKMLTLPKIKAAVAYARKAIDDEYHDRVMSAGEVLARLTEIARGDIGDLLDKDDDLENISIKKAKALDRSKLIRRVRQRITYIDGGENNNDQKIEEVDIEMYSAHDALRDLGKHYALFIDKSEQASIGLIQVVYGDETTDH